MARRQSVEGRNGLQIVLIAFLSLVIPTSGAVAQKAVLTLAPIDNGANAGCVLITINVKPEDSVITDVHLKNLGSRLHTAPPPKKTSPAETVTTKSGDPGNFRQDTPPAGWNGAENVTKTPPGDFTPGTPQLSEYTEDWTGPQLPQAGADFTLIYCGTKTLSGGDKDTKGLELTNGGNVIKGGEFPGFVFK